MSAGGRTNLPELSGFGSAEAGMRPSDLLFWTGLDFGIEAFESLVSRSDHLDASLYKLIQSICP